MGINGRNDDKDDGGDNGAGDAVIQKSLPAKIRIISIPDLMRIVTEYL
jgi:hypothetical protein